MKKVIIGLLVLALIAVGAFFVMKSSGWKTYENTRYEFSVEYPGSWTPSTSNDNSDGKLFVSPNEEISCYAYGFQNALVNEQGDPQTLNEFMNWLAISLGYDINSFEVIERNYTSMANKEAQELITLTEGTAARGVYILNDQAGRGLACYYPNLETMQIEDANFTHMQNSFKDNSGPQDPNMETCSDLLGTVSAPLKDLQIFTDTGYDEVATTAREYWDTSKLPAQVSNLESQDYICYPMPSDFDYDESGTEVIVIGVEWECELEYENWAYLSSNTTELSTYENQGFNCQKESCFSDTGQTDFVQFCTK
jgi:hypothetical protein